MSDTKIPLHQRLGADLRALRESRGLTQKEAARQLGITNSALSLIETGTSHTTLDRYQEYAEILGARFAVLLAGDGDAGTDIVLDLLENLEKLDKPQLRMLRAMLDLWFQEHQEAQQQRS